MSGLGLWSETDDGQEWRRVIVNRFSVKKYLYHGTWTRDGAKAVLRPDQVRFDSDQQRH